MRRVGLRARGAHGSVARSPRCCHQGSVCHNPLTGADAAPDLGLPVPRTVYHLVPYRLDTPIISQVAPRGDRGVSGRWTSRHPLVTRSAQRCQLRLKRWPRRRRRDPTSASPIVTTGEHRVCPGADTRCRLGVGIGTTWRGDHVGALRGEPRRILIPFETVRDDGRTSRWFPVPGLRCRRPDGPACFTTRPWRAERQCSRHWRAETHLRQKRDDQHPTTSHRATRPRSHRLGTAGSPSPTCVQPRSDVAITAFRLTCAERASDLLEPPDTRRRMGCPITPIMLRSRTTPRSGPAQNTSSGLSRKTLGCLASGPVGRALAACAGKPDVRSHRWQNTEQATVRPEGSAQVQSPVP